MSDPPGRTPCIAASADYRRDLFVSADLTGGPPRTPTQSSFLERCPLRRADSETIIANARTFARRQWVSTPLAPSLLRSSFDPDIKERKEHLEEELAFSIIGLPKGSSFAFSLYQHLASDEEIDKFLKKTNVYNSRKKIWRLPRSSESLQEDKMYKPLVKLLNAILEWFWKKEIALGLRKVLDTHSTVLPHKEAVETIHTSRPDCSVKAEGPSFQLPHKQTPGDIGYSNMASFFEVKVENKRVGFMKELLQIAAYVRQIFIQQPNRIFVRALLVTEQRFTLFHFDRSGIQHTEEFDLHSEKTRHVFVRLVLGLCSLHESDLGIDTSIQWDIEGGRKVRGTLKTRSKNKEEVIYDLAAIEPTWQSFDIRGSCTTYWSVVDPQSGEKLLVKDSWRSEERISERTYLEKAKDLPGVVQMISYEENRAETKNFRGIDNSSEVPVGFYSRISIRIVMKSEGKLIKDFTSPVELVCALRDAIAGHQLLYEKEIVHRDISMHNIMLGESGAEPGNRGMIAGLDMAIFTYSDRFIPTTNENGRTGDRTYWSIAALMRGDTDRITYDGPHDHLDDLEAFVYVLIHCTHGYSPQGEQLTLPRQLQKWALDTAWAAGPAKAHFLGDDLSRQVEKLWPKSCLNLLRSLMTFFTGVSKYKRNLARLPNGIREENVEKLMMDIDKHYDAVLRFFDQAIEDLDKEANGVPHEQTPTSWDPGSFTWVPSSPNPFFKPPSGPPRSHGISRLIDLQDDRVPRKRALEEYPDDQPEAKRGHDSQPKTPRRPRPKARTSAQVQGAVPSPLSKVFSGEQD
ncbi:hypothetical protein H1R20_g422, partial [Candolleomyces eurysporus]